MPTELDGRVLAAELTTNIRYEISALKRCGYRVPHFFIIEIGTGTFSARSVSSKQQEALAADINCSVTHFTHDISPEFLLRKILELNNAQNVDGIVLQMPFPIQIDTAVLQNIAADKDAANLRAYLRNTSTINDVNFVNLLNCARLDLTTKNVLLVGNASLMVHSGLHLQAQWPQINLMMSEGASANLETLARSADLIITTAQTRDLIQWHWMQDEANIINIDSAFSPTSNMGNTVSRMEAFLPLHLCNGPLAMAVILKNVLSASIKNQWQHSGDLDRGIFPLYRRVVTRTPVVQASAMPANAGITKNVYSFDMS